MNLITLPQYKAEQLRGDPWTHIISIRTPGDDAANLAEGFGSYCYVVLADDSQPHPEAVRKIVSAVRFAVARQAARLVVHCHMGVSRSVGVARAIAEHYGLPYASDFTGNYAVKLAVKLAVARALGAS